MRNVHNVQQALILTLIMIITTNISGLRNNISELTNRVVFGNERILVERSGKLIAALISVDDLKKLEALEPRRDTKSAEWQSETNEMADLGDWLGDLITEVEL